MKKIVLCFIFVFILCGSVNADEFEKRVQLADGYCISYSNGYGITDENDNVIVPFRYDRIIWNKELCYGAIVQENKTDYYRLESGEETFYKSLSGEVYRMSNGEFGYRIEQSAEDNFNKPRLTEQYGLVDTNLNIIIKPKYDNELLFDKYGYAVVYQHSTSIERTKYEDDLPHYCGGSCGVIDRKGRTVLGMEYENITPGFDGWYSCRPKAGYDQLINIRYWGKLFVIFHILKKLFPLFIVWLIYAFVKKRKSLKLMRSTV